MGSIPYNNDNFMDALRPLFNSLNTIEEGDNIKENARQHAIRMLENISDTLDDHHRITAPEEDVRFYQQIALKLGNDKIIALSRRFIGEEILNG